MAERKVQSQLLVPPITRDRVDALALVRGDTRAEVYRVLIEDALPEKERTFAEGLKQLDQIAEKFKMTRTALVRRMLADKLKVEDVAEERVYPRRRKA